MTTVMPAPFSTSPWRFRAMAVCIVGGFWFFLGLLLQVEKLIMLPGGPTVVELLLGMLPEIGVWLLGAALLMVLATLPGLLGKTLWWLGFFLISAAYYALSVAEFCYVQYTGMRMHARTVEYGVLNFQELKLIIEQVIGDTFYWRMAVAGILFAVSWLVLWVLRRHAGKVSPRLPVIFFVIGIVLLLIPMPERIQENGLAGAMVIELLRPAPTLDELYADIPESMAEQAPGYRRPELTPAPLSEPEGRPNLVVIILESTGSSIVPPYSDPQTWHELPVMAKLAEESVVFDPVYASVSHTSKALVGILCGTFPRPILDIREAVAGWPWPLSCLPELLEGAGYRTAFLQSAQEVFENRLVLVRNMGFGTAAFQETLYREPFKKLGYFSMEDKAMVEPALQWATSGDQPFFLTLLTSSVHHPYDVPGLPRNRDPLHFPAYYRAALKQQDEFLGQFLDGLDAAGLEENTLVVVVGDHGEAFGEHLGMQHNWVPYEEVVRVPLLMRGPGLGEPRRIQRLSQHLDLMPTLLNLLSIPWQGELPGHDLFNQEPPERVWSSCWGSRTCMSMREGDLKIVYHFGYRPTQFFDLAADPLELENLAFSMTEQERLRMEHELLARLRAVDRFWAENDAQIEQAPEPHGEP